MQAIGGSIARLSICCLVLARDYLVLRHSLYRLCAWGVACVFTLLIGCFVVYAFAEKYHLESNFFYGRVRFSFIDGGYAEIFGYVLELGACAIFLLYARRPNKKHWYMWAAILFVVLLDDGLKIHETIGGVFSSGLGMSPVVGDLVGFALTGLLSVGLWIAGLRIIPDQGELCAYLVFTVYFSILIFFGVGVDAAHGLLGKNMSQTLFTLIEDGGELLMICIISLSSLGMWLQKQRGTTDSMSIDSTLFVQSKTG